MGVILLISLALLPFLILDDPAPSMIRSRDHAHSLDCEWLSTANAVRRYPGEIETSGPRGDFMERSAVICRERLMRPGLRSARDEALLSSLESWTAELAVLTQAVQPELQGRTWLVEVFYPSTQVSGKISFATKNMLVAQGLKVSDRTPTLAVGDIDVLTRLTPEQAYPAACQRYHATGGVGDDDVLLALVSRDHRETALHVGLCSRGHWSWLR